MSTLATREAEPLRGAERARTREDDEVPEFDVLYRRWFRFTWSVLRRLGVPQPAIEDAAQEVWVIVHRRLDALESPRAVRSWLFQIARRVAARHRRGEQRSRRKLDALGLVPAHRNLPHADRDSLLTVETLLGQLDARKREAFVLSELEGWSAPEIAKAAGTNPNTVYSRIRLAREELRAGWEARCPDADLELALADLRERTEPPKGASKRCWLVLGPKLALGSPTVAASVGAVATWKLAIAGAAVIGMAAVGGTYIGRGGSGRASDDAVSRASAEDHPRERGGAADASKRAGAPDSTTPPSLEPVPLQAAAASSAALAPSDAAASGTSLATDDAPASALASGAASSSATSLATDDAPASASSSSRSRRPTAATDTPSLDDENGLLTAAQTSLAAGEPARALAQLAEHRERFATSPLADLRMLLELKALCAAGRETDAEAALRRAEATMPTSALLPKMRRTCAS